MKTSLKRAVDAYSASPALRLRHRILVRKASVRPAQHALPPPVGEPRNDHDNDDFAVAKAFDDGNVLARLMMLRADAAAEVERLLTFLDTTEGIADAEECGDEQDGDLAGSPSDREEDGADDEPWLGAPEIAPAFNRYFEKWGLWLEQQGDQTRWASGSDDDREEEPEHDEDGADAEPDDSGIADQDGYMEQCPALFQHSDRRVD